MRPFAPGEWSATLGWMAWRFWLLVYVFSLVPALLIGAAPLPRAAILAVMIWTCGALIVAAGAAYCLSRFRRQAFELLLPGRQMVLVRAILWLSAVVVALPAISFWMLAPGSRPWMALIMAAPVAAALTTSLCARSPPARADGRDSSSVRYARPTAGQVVCMFIGSPFTGYPSDLRGRAAAVLGLLVWATPPALCLTLSTRAWKILTMAYLAVTFIVIWSWFMAALARFGSHRTGNFSELALLPGLGDASRRRHALYRAVLARPLLLAFCGLSGFLFLTCWQSHVPARTVPSILCGIVLLLFCSGGPFQLLMARDMPGIRVQVVNAINATLVPLVVSLAVIQILPGQVWSWLSRSGAQWFCFLLLALLAAVPLSTIWFYTSGLARQAHPFLAPVE